MIHTYCSHTKSSPSHSPLSQSLRVCFALSPCPALHATDTHIHTYIPFFKSLFKSFSQSHDAHLTNYKKEAKSPAFFLDFLWTTFSHSNFFISTPCTTVFALTDTDSLCTLPPPLSMYLSLYISFTFIKLLYINLSICLSNYLSTHIYLSKYL